MFLEKLQIQGFKSFAKKNVLSFPGMINGDRRGITCIVGPNGSGKSNIADAVRWALGEQSMKALRGKRGEDVIFSGSDKKGKLGMAEVSLFLNNENSSRKKSRESKEKEEVNFLDYSEIILTRRLYRNGDSEYLINNSRVRLADTQMFLAKANFGQKTYSVIGQGIVEGFLNTSLSERKEFFDEATGVKKFQIKRDESLNKLRLSYENLSQANMLLIEIGPRLRSLTRQVNKLEKREALETELKDLQLKYYSKNWHEINNKYKKYSKEFLELESVKRGKEGRLEQLNRELGKIEYNGKADNKYEEKQQNLESLHYQKEKLVRELAKLDARVEAKLESSGKFDLSWLHNKKSEITEDKRKIEEEINSLERKVKDIIPVKKSLDKEDQKIDEKLNRLNSELAKLAPASREDSGSEIDLILEKTLKRLRQAEIEASIEKIKEIIKNIKYDLKKIIKGAGLKKDKERIESIQENIIKLTQAKAKITAQVNDNNLRIQARTERIKLLKEKQSQLEKELGDILAKTKEGQSQTDSGGTSKEESDLKGKLNATEVRISQVKKDMDGLKEEEGKERDKLFSLQKDIHALQSEINELSVKLGELKVNSTRHETRLEDLESEIRREFGNLREARESKIREDVDTEGAREKMGSLKRQLELIGGIDPEIAKEHKETKERYDFLFGQSSDLEAAIKSLENIIKELDITIRAKFDQEFKVIHKKFEEYFKILFSGGTCKIIKVMDKELDKLDDEDMPQENENGEIKQKVKPEMDIKKIKFLQKHNATGLAGIDIQATPPGKKIKSISMLSGGERALTAIALICAIISANPSPFVVLDEVDAALDEANSERFAKILDDLSHKTQFIIITHNRATMRRANVLYGITMGIDGISKLLSVKLEDVKVG